nr:MAG TPA: AntA/AntB antirepressor [Caudoviricetes sp.]
MNELVKVNFETQTVSARELHEQLHIVTRFNDWFPRMCEYGFEEGTDFYSKMSKTSETGGRPSVDYEISVDMAKQICMVQKTPEGKAVRQYLIDLEKAWNTPEQIMARALDIAHKTINSLKEENLVMKPKAEYFDELVERNLLTSFRTTAKEFGIKESALIGWLIENKYIYRDQKNKLCAYAAPKTDGLFDEKEYTSKHSTHAGTQTLITPKGRETFRILMKI